MWRLDGIREAPLSPFDRGLAYGDGVFRTLRVEGGRPLFWRQHHARLATDAAALGLPCPDERLLRAELRDLIDECGDGVVKCMLTRGAAGRGYRLPEPVRVTRLLLWSPLPEPVPRHRHDGVDLHLCRLRLAAQPALAGVKHLNRLENVLARAEWNDPQLAEGLLLDQEGFIVEGVMSNVFWRAGHEWETPLLDRCGVAGVTRAWLMDCLRRQGLPVREVRAPLPRLLEADEVLLCNSVIGLWPVRTLQQRRWHAFPTIQGLQGLLEEAQRCTQDDGA